MPDFLPRRDALLLGWSANFAEKTSASAEALHIPPEMAQGYARLHAAFAEAHQRANQPDTRSPSAILAKDLLRGELTKAARILAAIVRSRPEVSDTQRLELGLRPRAGAGSGVPGGPPREAPFVQVVSVVGRRVRLRLRDAAAAPGRTAKPHRVQGAMIYSYACVPGQPAGVIGLGAGDQPPDALAEWRMHATTTRTTVEIDFAPDLPPGTGVWLAAVWFDHRGRQGPASAPVMAHLGWGVTAAAA